MSRDLQPLNQDERNWGVAIHLAALFGLLLPLGLVLGPLLVWFLKRNDSDFLDNQGKKAINFQLTILVIAFIVIVLSVAIRPLIAVAFMTGIAGIVFALIAGYHVYSDNDFDYPFAFNILK